jgi:hypothetical protein
VAISEAASGSFFPSLWRLGGYGYLAVAGDSRAGDSRAGDAGGDQGFGQPQRGEPLEERAEHDLKLHAREGSAQAVVRTVAEGQVGVVFSRQVQPVGIGEHGRVAVGDDGLEEHRVTSRDGDCADLDIGVRVAELAEPGARRDEPDQFLDGVGDQRGVPQEEVLLVRVEQEQDRTEVDGAGRGRVAREEQTHREVDDVVRGEVALPLGGDEVADHVLGGRGPLQVDQTLHVLGQAQERPGGALRVVDVVKVGSPGGERRPVARGTPSSSQIT